MCDSAVNTLSFCFLGTIIIQDLESSVVSAKAQQRLKKFNLPKSIMVHFYTPVIESMLTSCATMWYPALTAKQRADCRPSSSLLRGLSAAACSLYRTCTPPRHGAGNIMADLSHLGHRVFEIYPAAHLSQNLSPQKHFVPSCSSGLINDARGPCWHGLYPTYGQSVNTHLRLLH